jgi:hypothetical protein
MGIDSFDQWGVVPGKARCSEVPLRFGNGDTLGLGRSTAGLLVRLGG